VFEADNVPPVDGIIKVKIQGRMWEIYNVGLFLLGKRRERASDLVIQGTGSSLGDSIEIELPPTIERYDSGVDEFVPVTDVYSPYYDERYRNIGQYLLADRLFQQPQGLETIEGTIYKCIPFDMRLQITNSDINVNEAPIFINTGNVIDFNKGTTEVSAIELPDDIKKKNRIVESGDNRVLEDDENRVID
jgi:hypothetical protein